VVLCESWQRVSPAVFTTMKQEVKARKDGGWERVEWAMAAPVTAKQAEVVQGRLMAFDPKAGHQITLSITLSITETSRTQLVLAGIQNRTSGRYLAAMHRILAAVMFSSSVLSYWPG
jgi:hypothetical protein